MKIGWERVKTGEIIRPPPFLKVRFQSLLTPVDHQERWIQKKRCWCGGQGVLAAGEQMESGSGGPHLGHGGVKVQIQGAPSHSALHTDLAASPPHLTPMGSAQLLLYCLGRGGGGGVQGAEVLGSFRSS